MPDSHFDAPPIADRPESPYVCPGTSTAVSRAIHLARIHAAWPGCDQCEWRDDVEGLARSSQEQLQQIRQHRSGGIQRTEYGIRGIWKNQLDRVTAASLIRIFCDALVRPAIGPSAGNKTDHRESATPADGEPRQLRHPPLVVGFDGRASSLDLFVGITTAIREFGLTVNDIGRCTAASILESARCLDGVKAAVFVTGSGGSAAITGFDVMEPNGDPVAVQWKDYGICFAQPTREVPSNEQLDHMDRDPAVQPHSVGTNRHLEFENTGKLPMLMRVSRDFGVHQHVDFEDRYRRNLLRWYPRHSTLSMVVRSGDPVVQERIRWLVQQCDLNLSCSPATSSAAAVASPVAATIRLDVAEDDREFVVFRSNGQRLPADRLAQQINSAIQSSASQITAHADAVTGRFWLTDAARPTSRTGSEQVTDALAVAGLLLKLSGDGLLQV